MDYGILQFDLVFKNGTVVTVDEEDRVCEALGVRGRHINFVGSNEELEDVIGRSKSVLGNNFVEPKVIDLKGKTLTPGFIDTHYHPILSGLIGDLPTSPMINTSIKRCKNIKELLGLIKEALSFKKEGQWVSTMGYEPTLLDEKRHPTIEELDEIAPNNPVHCMHGGGHICMYNTEALKILGVNSPEDAKKFPEDEVEVVDGKLTGMVRGHTHFWLWGQVEYTEEAQKEAALKSQKHCLENGITSIHDCGELGKTSYHIMQKLCRNREFKIRSYMMLHSIFGKDFSMAENNHWHDLGLMSGLGNEYFRIGSTKFMIDGGSGGPSCATREPYSHNPDLPREKGWTKEEVAEYLEKVNNAECQASAHAIGDEAIEMMVDGYRKAFVTNPRPDLRHRIEHCTISDEELIQGMAEMNICPSVNISSISVLGSKFKKFYGEERNKYICALRTMLDKGVMCSLHSDAPSYPAGVVLLDSAVNRIDRTTGEQCDQTQAITILEAIRCATINGAYASYEEKIKGSLEVGKLADLVVLSEDVLAIEKEKLNTVKVEMTVLDGEILY